MMENGLSAIMLQHIDKAADVLRRGGTAAYPTDTVYGLGADIYNADAVRKVYSAKRRPSSMPLPVLIADISQLNGLVSSMPPAALVLINTYWPGALTIILDKTPAFDSPLLSGGNKIAVRQPAHAITLQLIKELGRPITGTSANRHDMKTALTADEVREQLGSEVDFVLDGGRCPGGTESTIMDMTVSPPRIIREGAIDKALILQSIS
jgi:L-threonylcarbamoyladenylate synthase